MLMRDDLQLKNKDELIHLLAMTQEKTAEKDTILTEQKTTLLSQENQLSEKENQLSEKENKIILCQEAILQLKEHIRSLTHKRFGKSSEKYVADELQGRLFNEAMLPTNQAEIEATEAEITIPAHQRKKTGRKGLPKELPRERIEYDLSDDEKICQCGSELTLIGEETTEQLDIIPAKIKVIEHVCKKYACQHCEENIKTAKKPKQPIPKSIAAPGLLAEVLSSKFDYHMPLYRQEKKFHSLGVALARNTLSLWVIRCSQLLQPLVNLLQDEILSYDRSYADESTLQVLKEDNKTAESKSYMWVFGGGPPDRFSYLYQYHPSLSSWVLSRTASPNT